MSLGFTADLARDRLADIGHALPEVRLMSCSDPWPPAAPAQRATSMWVAGQFGTRHRSRESRRGCRGRIGTHARRSADEPSRLGLLHSPLDEGADSPRFPVASPEDTVLAKLEWFRLDGETSERQWWDIVGVLRVTQKANVEYLRRWALSLRVEDLLERALAEARS